MKRSIICACAAAALTFTAASADGQQITSPYDFVETAQGIRGFASWVFTDRGAMEMGPHSGAAFGLGYNIRISGPFELDAQASFFPTTRTVFDDTPQDSTALTDDPTLGLVELGTADLSLLLVDATLRFDLTGPRTWNAFQPFALIGVGGAFVVTSDNSAEEDLPDPAVEDLRVRFRNGFTGHVGAGVEWHASQRFTLRAEARDLLWKVHVPETFLQRGRLIDTEEWVQTAHLTLGLVWRF